MCFLKPVIYNVISRIERDYKNHKMQKYLQSFIGFKYTIPDGSLVNIQNITPKKDCLLTIGHQSIFVGKICFDREGGIINIGDRTYIAGNIFCATKINIGNDVLISSDGGIFDHDSHSLFFERRSDDVTNYIKGKKDWSHVSIAEIIICDKVWIGYNVIILKGVTVGEGAVVGTGSVVTKDVPPYTLVVGNPARVVKSIQ